MVRRPRLRYLADVHRFDLGQDWWLELVRTRASFTAASDASPNRHPILTLLLRDFRGTLVTAAIAILVVSLIMVGVAVFGGGLGRGDWMLVVTGLVAAGVCFGGSVLIRRLERRHR